MVPHDVQLLVRTTCFDIASTSIHWRSHQAFHWRSCSEYTTTCWLLESKQYSRLASCFCRRTRRRFWRSSLMRFLRSWRLACSSSMLCVTFLSSVYVFTYKSFVGPRRETREAKRAQWWCRFDVWPFTEQRRNDRSDVPGGPIRARGIVAEDHAVYVGCLRSWTWGLRTHPWCSYGWDGRTAKYCPSVDC